MTMIKTNETGRSMIEMLGVLAIIGVLSVGGIAGYSKAMNKFKTNKVADNVSMLVANIKTLYAQQNTYTGLNNENAVSMGVVPDELVGSDKKTLTNAFNGLVFIDQSDSTIANDGKAFIIEFNSLSREACITLATNDWGSGYSSGLIAMQVSGTSVTTGTTKGSALGSVMIGENQKAVNGIAMTAATGSNSSTTKNDKGEDVTTLTAQTPVPMPVVTAATACACNAGNTCSISWKYY